MPNLILGTNWKSAEYNSADVHGGSGAFTDGGNTVYRWEIVAVDGGNQAAQLSISTAATDWQDARTHLSPMPVQNMPTDLGSAKLYGLRSFAPNSVNGQLRLVGEVVFLNADKTNIRLVEAYIDGVVPVLFSTGGGVSQADFDALKGLVNKIASDAAALYARVGGDEGKQTTDEAAIGTLQAGEVGEGTTPPTGGTTVAIPAGSTKITFS